MTATDQEMQHSASRLYDPPGPSLGSFRVLDVVEADLSERNLSGLKTRLTYALEHFPELNETTVTIAKKPEDHTWFAEADWVNDIVYLPTHTSCPYITICHELGHLAINVLDERGADVPPSSEEFCSIFSVARMPADRIDSHHISYLGNPQIPRDEWPATCQRALDYREEKRNYIQKCKEWLEVEDDES